jgi:phosphatidylinositol dimannoside acyltransferase
MKKSLLLQAEGIAWLAGWRVARALPEHFVVRAFERMALRSMRRNPARRALVATNLEPVVGRERLDEVLPEAFRSYGRYWAETFRMQDLSAEELDRRFTCKGRENIQAAYDGGRGGVLATLHIGNWDAGGRWVAERWPLTAVAEVLRPRMLFDRFVELRRSLGITIVPLEKGGDAIGRCMQQLEKGDMVALVADRDLSGTGVEVTMFGRKTKMPPGPSVLALRAGVPLIPACIYQREGGTWFADVREALPMPDATEGDPVHALTQRLADAFEELIAAAPEQWHMWNRYWID